MSKKKNAKRIRFGRIPWGMIATAACLCLVVGGVAKLAGTGRSTMLAVSEKTSGTYAETTAAAFYNGDGANYGISYDSEHFEMAAETVAPSGAASEESQKNRGRKLITTVNITMETEEFDALTSWVDANVIAVGGYAEYSNSGFRWYSGSDTRYQSYTLRIPADQLDAFLSGMETLGNITGTSRNTQDITLTYTDTESHVTALTVEQQRLLELLEEAKSLDEILMIEDRLTNVRYELEWYASQLRSYDNQVDYSTVTLMVYEVKEYTAPEPVTVGERIRSGFSENLQKIRNFLTNLFVGFVVSLPTILLGAVCLAVVIVIVRAIVKKKKK